MATIINNPPANDNSGGPMGMIIGVIVLIVLVYLGYVYGLPAVRQMGTPQINVPSKIDVNVNQTK
jgi:hypothetical protein